MTVVIDEADSMLSEPHRTDLNALMKATVLRDQSPSQLVVASATGGSVHTQNTLATLFEPFCAHKRCLFPVSGSGSINDAKSFFSPIPPTLEHAVILLPQHKFFGGLRSLLNTNPFPEAAIVFVSDSWRVKIVCEKLLEMNIIAAPLHGDSSKADRTEVWFLQVPCQRTMC